MITTKYAYPGDPVLDVTLMFGAEFEAANPNREIVVSGVNGEDATHIPVPEVFCDSCNALVTPLDPCALTDRRLYCWECYGEWVKPHIVKG